MARREFTRAVYAQIVRRAMNEAGHIVCEGCGLVLGKKPYQIDHTKPDALEIDKSRKLTAADGKLLGQACCHAPKTKQDVKVIAQAKRREANSLGLPKPKSRRAMPGSRNSPWKMKIGGGAVRRDEEHDHGR